MNSLHMRVIRKNVLKQRVPYSDTHILRLEKAGQFPKRVRLGPNAIGWIESEIDEWLEARVAARDGEAA